MPNLYKEEAVMPNLKHLIEELQELDVDPENIRLPGPLYDDLLEQAETEEED